MKTLLLPLALFVLTACPKAESGHGLFGNALPKAPKLDCIGGCGPALGPFPASPTPTAQKRNTL